MRAKSVGVHCHDIHHVNVNVADSPLVSNTSRRYKSITKSTLRRLTHLTHNPQYRVTVEYIAMPSFFIFRSAS